MKKYSPALPKGSINLKFLITITVFLFCAFANAQNREANTEEWIRITIPTVKHDKLKIDCKEIGIDNCNQISNNIFKPHNYESDNFDHISDPFGNLLVPSWLPSHGTPNIYDGVNFTIEPPFEGLGYCRMAAWVSSHDDYKNNGEGIVQKIPALKKNNRYALSFFKRLTYEQLHLDNFYIVLIRCSDYTLFSKDFSYMTPTFPENSQIIYCEKQVSNIKWEQVFETFTAKDNYDMIWFLPKMGDKKEEKVSEILLSYPELIDVTNFSAGIDHYITDFNESILIGPNTPNCSVYGSEFVWTSPNGVTTSSPTAQNIAVDLSRIESFGLWKLSLQVPNAVRQNNSCSDESNTVNSGVTVLERPSSPSNIDCSNLGNPIGCNFIINNNFTPVNYDPQQIEDYADPFSNSLIPSWLNSHGSPNIYDGINFGFPAPPSPATGFAGMAAIQETAPETEGEGIVQKISELNPNKNYALSFFKRRVNFMGGLDNAICDFIVVLMNCEDYNLMDHSSYATPDIPANSQIIYCERNVQDMDWHQNVISFQPNAAYDMIWIFPRINPASENRTQTYLLFAYPELIDITNFSAGIVSPASPISPNCNVTIGPVTPNCSFTNAIYTWYGPNGQVHSGTSQQLLVNTSDNLNVGMWTLRMTSPTNNSSNCGVALLASATVNVPGCAPACAPTITPRGPIEYYRGWEWSAAAIHTPSYPYGVYTLKSSSPTGNQWYVDNIPIPAYAGGNEQYINPYNAIGSRIPNDELPHYFKVIVNGCESSEVEYKTTFYNYTNNYYGFNEPFIANTPIYTCENSDFTMRMIDVGPNANYTFNIGFNFEVSGITNPTSIIASPNYNTRRISVAAGSHQYHTPPYVLNIADQDGRQTVMDYIIGIYPEDLGTVNGGCDRENVYAHYSTMSALKPGGTKFDWEDYEFPTGSSLILPDFNSYIISTNPLILHIPGRSELSNPIKVRFNSTSGYWKKHFYFTSNNDGECYVQKRQFINQSIGCRTNELVENTSNTEETLKQVSIFPNPSTGEVRISGLLNEFKSVEVFSSNGILLKREVFPLTKNKTININNLPNGLYNLKIQNEKEVIYKRIVLYR